MTWLTAMEYLCNKWPRICSLVVSISRSFPHSWLITRFVSRLTRRVPLVEQELLTLPEHLSSHPIFSGVRVTRSLVICVCFVYRCLSFCTFSFSNCVVCSSPIYRFWLPLWYLQTLLQVLWNQQLGYPVSRPFDCIAPNTSELFGFPIFRFWAYLMNKGNNKITELRTILERESQNS
jgi:hypothetical protein